ncbi:MAG TPA: hypothetical protein VG096_10585 [Bryobacteraceae bacterium]|jgi:hypothetical protein|nr:hypothetical protein [Bryobacteraceae bacterium]
MVNRLDAELARQLRRVAAPEDLWLRIQEPRQGYTGAVLRWPVWAFAAAVAATIALFCLSLARGVQDVPFRAADSVQNRAWVQPHANHIVPARASIASSAPKNARAGCVLCHS